MLDHATQQIGRSCPENDSAEYFSATVFPTQHCPGSVAFIFEGYFGKYVYVGDMRLEYRGEADELPEFLADLELAPDAHKVPWREMEGADRLYMDTTFANCIWEALPMRLESIESVLNLIAQAPKEQAVLLECGMLGTEPVLICVSERFKSRIFAGKALYDKLAKVPGVKKCLTQDKSSTRFVALPHGSLSKGTLDNTLQARNVSRSVAAMDALCIKPSTQWFGFVSATKTIDCRPTLHNGVWHVLYSIHSSFREMRMFIAKVRPFALHPLVSLKAPDLKLLESLCSRVKEEPTPVHGFIARGSDSEQDETEMCDSGPIPPRIAYALRKTRRLSSMRESPEISDGSLHGVVREAASNDFILDVNSSVDLSVIEFLHSDSNNSSIEVHEKEKTETFHDVASVRAVDPNNWQSLSNSGPVKSIFGDMSTYVDSDNDDNAVEDDLELCNSEGLDRKRENFEKEFREKKRKAEECETDSDLEATTREKKNENDKEKDVDVSPSAIAPSPKRKCENELPLPSDASKDSSKPKDPEMPPTWDIFELLYNVEADDK